MVFYLPNARIKAKAFSHAIMFCWGKNIFVLFACKSIRCFGSSSVLYRHFESKIDKSFLFVFLFFLIRFKIYTISLSPKLNDRNINALPIFAVIAEKKNKNFVINKILKIMPYLLKIQSLQAGKHVRLPVRALTSFT